jgi:elongation factor Ts
MTTAPDLNKLVMELRAKTGAGMMDCKKALTESNGDFEGALTVLRKKGLSDAAKKSGRTTKEGVVAFAVVGNAGAIVEVNSETDFVARNEAFVKLGDDLALKYAKAEFKTVDEAKDTVLPVFQKLSENMGLRRFERFELKGPGLIAGYAHKTDPKVGAKQGALIEISAPNAEAAKSPELQALAKELLLQIVAAKPKFLRREDVPAAEIEKEKEVYTELLRKEGKPEASFAKIIEGKINKLFYQQLCLLEMVSVREDKQPVANIIKETGAKLGGGVSVTRFARYQLGE